VLDQFLLPDRSRNVAILVPMAQSTELVNGSFEGNENVGVAHESKDWLWLAQ
jgi:hypothetical protein